MYWNKILYSNVHPWLSIWACQASLEKLPIAQLILSRSEDTFFKLKIAPIVLPLQRHIFFYKCPLASKVRHILDWNHDVLQGNITLFTAWNQLLYDTGRKDFWNEILLCWKLWQARNQRLFYNIQLPVYAILMAYLSMFNNNDCFDFLLQCVGASVTQNTLL